MIPANWIPPQYREDIYGEMTEEEIQNGMNSMWIYDKKGRYPVSRKEFLEKTKKVIGVRDTRNGRIHWMSGTSAIERLLYG